eukprot:scaffold259326_cov27-Tisochrysis_lutea.AAC.1
MSSQLIVPAPSPHVRWPRSRLEVERHPGAHRPLVRCPPNKREERPLPESPQPPLFQPPPAKALAAQVYVRGRLSFARAPPSTRELPAPCEALSWPQHIQNARASPLARDTSGGTVPSVPTNLRLHHRLSCCSNHRADKTVSHLLMIWPAVARSRRRAISAHGGSPFLSQLLTLSAAVVRAHRGSQRTARDRPAQAVHA